MRRPRLAPRTADLVLAGVALVALWTEILAAGDGESPLPGKLALGAAIALPLALRRRAPFAATAVMFASASVAVAWSPDLDDVSTPFLVICAMTYALGTIPDQRRSLRALALAEAGVIVLAASFTHQTTGDFLFPMGFVLAAWGMGRTVSHRARLTEELHEVAVRAREEREAEQARAVAEERRRIAREMHDVIAHSVSVMVVQAGGARRILDRDPERAAEAATRIEQAGRTALAEMRRLLGVLHPDETDPALLPQPTLDELDALVRRARAAGLPVGVEHEGERGDLPAGAEVAAYRIVQEALTNALKHAGGAPTRVRLVWDDEALEVEVVNRGGGRPGGVPDLPSGSHGIVGMRERVRVYGGALEAGPRPGGGFEVRARLPLRRREVQVA